LLPDLESIMMMLFGLQLKLLLFAHCLDPILPGLLEVLLVQVEVLVVLLVLVVLVYLVVLEDLVVRWHLD